VDYPIWNPHIGGGVLIGLIAIAHVVVSHFAIGGGLAIAILETLAVGRRSRALRDLARRSSLMLILVSTVFGAISGVAIWAVIGVVSPAATSALIHNYVWGWAIEWCFFLLEVATALAYYATWDRVSPRTHLFLIWTYFVAAFLSLVIIQGILSFMLTPGRWLVTHGFWDGFFNPSYFPGVILRTGTCLLLAGSYLALAALREKDPKERSGLLRLLAGFQIVGALVAYGGFRWWAASLPPEVRTLSHGQNALLPGLQKTEAFALWSLTLLLALALLAWIAPRRHRWPVALVALLAGFAFLGGYERLREGSRKPFVIRGYMFSNGVLVSEVGKLNQEGILSKARWAARESDGSPEEEGRAVFRAECSSCHTLDGYLPIRRLLGSPDPDRVTGIIGLLREDGEKYAASQGRIPDGLNYPFMAPFVGNDEEAAALARYLEELNPRPMASNAGPVDRSRGGER